MALYSNLGDENTLRAMLARAEKGGFKAEANGTAADESELARELAEVQSQFDAYKNEMGHDSDRLREEVLALQREIARLTAGFAKANANAEYQTGKLPSSFYCSVC